MTGWTVELSPWPYRSQLAQSETDDGSPPENASLDCGEDCLSMLIQYLTGLIVWPDTIKDAILGQHVTGPTSEWHLTGYLANRATTNATIYRPTDRGAAMSIIRDYIRGGKAVLVLRYASYVGDPASHWNCIIGGGGTDDTHTADLITADPWGGFRRSETRDTFWSWTYPYSPDGGRLLLGIERQRDAAL